jgi:sulfur-carrier protein adenylyltransferase/sulfurtransferase
MKMDRFSKQTILPELGRKGQEKLRSAKVLVVGAGGLGCPVILYLAAAGVGTIGIADGDHVTLQNLNRQVLFGIDDINSKKPAAAAKTINRLYPDINIEVYNCCLTVENAPEIIPSYDLIIDGTDNFASRYLINDAAVLFEKPLVYGAVFKFEGQIALFNAGRETANYRDLYPDLADDGRFIKSCQSGLIGVVPGIIGILQAAEAVKWIAGIGKPLINRVIFYNLADHSVYETELKPNATAQRKRPATLEAFLSTDYMQPDKQQHS